MQWKRDESIAVKLIYYSAYNSLGSNCKTLQTFMISSISKSDSVIIRTILQQSIKIFTAYPVVFVLKFQGWRVYLFLKNKKNQFSKSVSFWGYCVWHTRPVAFSEF